MTEDNSQHNFQRDNICPASNHRENLIDFKMDLKVKTLVKFQMSMSPSSMKVN